MVLAMAPVSATLPNQRAGRFGSRPSRRSLLVRANNGPLREFNENDGKLSASSGSGDAPKKQEGEQKFLYADENPQPPRDTMSKEMKERLRREYYGLGGSPNQAMSSNYFLWIILGVSFLAVLSKLTGAL